MRTVRLCSKSTPFRLSMNVVTKCLRVCSPSVTMSMPAASWSASRRRMASRLPSSRSSPSRSQGAQSFFGSASQPGLGRLPAMVVCRIVILRAPPEESVSSDGFKSRSFASLRMTPLLARGEVPGGEAAADVDLRAIAVTDQLEPAPVGGAVGGDPVADFGRAVADGGQALVQEIDQRALVAFFEVADTFPGGRRLRLSPRGRPA